MLVATGILGLLTAAVAITSWRSATTAAQSPRPTQRSEEIRAANANTATANYLATPANRQTPILALVSFQRGLTTAAALAELRQRAPDATPAVVAYGVTDSSGQRHTASVFIRPGENPEQKATQASRAMFESIRSNARKILDCTNPPPACPPANSAGRSSLNAQAQLDVSQARVHGIAVRGPASGIERLLTNRGSTIRTVEVLRDNPFVSPLWPATTGGN